MLKKLTFFIGLPLIAFLLTQCSADELDSLEETVQENDVELLLPAATSRSQSQIPNQYIVVLKEERSMRDDIEQIREIAKGLSRKHGISRDSIKQVYGKALKGFAIHLNRGQLKKLEKENEVDYIIPDKVIQLAPPPGKGKNKDNDKDDTGTPPSQSIPWGITDVGGAKDGTGKTAWVLDSGIDVDHPDLNVDTRRGFSALGGRDRGLDDGNGHGTHVAGTIAALDNGIGVVGVAAGATVVPVKVLNSRGSGSYSAVLAGIDYVARNGQPGDVANLSLGGPVDATVDNAVIEAAKTGIHFVLAAGNSSTDVSTFSPGRANGENVYTVSAMDSQHRFASFSNYGSAVDFAAPGVGILSTYKGGGYSTLNGTSMAAPHVAGVLLLGTANANGYVLNDPDGVADPIVSQ